MRALAGPLDARRQAGKALVGERQPVARRSQQGFLDMLSATERRTLVALLRRVLDANDRAR